MPALKKVIMYLPCLQTYTLPLPRILLLVAFVFFFFFPPVVLFKFSPCSALVIKSFKHKAGSMGSVYSFPKSIILHINHWSGTFGQCWICYVFFFLPFLAALLMSLTVHRFQAALTLDDLFIWLTIFVPLKNNDMPFIVQRNHNELNWEAETLIFQLVLFLHGKTD